MEDKDLKQLLKKDVDSLTHEGSRTEWAGINEKISDRSIINRGERIISILSGVALAFSLLLVFKSTHNQSLPLTDQDIANLEEFYLEDNYLDETKELYTWVE